MDFGIVAERKIQEAAEEGAFDNLPGKGKPLPPDDGLPPHLRILKNASIPPDWILLNQEIGRLKAECGKLWARVEREYPRRRPQADRPSPKPSDPQRMRREFAEWHTRQRDAYLRAIQKVNHEILKWNLAAPAFGKEHLPYRKEEEMRRFDDTFPALPDFQVSLPVKEKREPGILRQSSQSLYSAMQRRDETR